MRKPQKEIQLTSYNELALGLMIPSIPAQTGSWRFLYQTCIRLKAIPLKFWMMKK